MTSAQLDQFADAGAENFRSALQFSSGVRRKLQINPLQFAP